MLEVSLCVVGLAALACGQAAPRAPNVVFLLVDDLGWADIAPNRPDTFYETPNVSRLAREGMNFSQAYAASPVCSPNRASVMSGLHPTRLDTTQYFGGPQPAGLRSRESWRRPLYPAAYLDRLPLEARTLAEAAKSVDYRTAFLGKWHLGPHGFWPEDQGFDLNVAGHHAGHPTKGYFAPWGFPTLSESADGTYLTTRLTDEAVGYLDAHVGDERPFLLFFAYYQVHTPLQGRPELVEHYEAKRGSVAADRPVFGKEGDHRVRQVQEHAVYGAMVHAMDESVGRVLEALDRNGLAENTLVVFTSDNGGLSTSEGLPTSNLPLRAGKGWLYEGGIRVPCVVRWPGRVAPGAASEVPVMSTDFLPTFCELAGAEPVDARFADGVSLLPLWTAGRAPDRDALYWHYPHYSNQGGRPSGAIRVGDWKLVEDFETDRVELYDLARDVGELSDLAAADPDRASDLRARLHAWRAGIGARMPTRR